MSDLEKLRVVIDYYKTCVVNDYDNTYVIHLCDKSV